MVKVRTKKKNPNKQVATQADIKKAANRLRDELDSMKVELTADATRYVQALLFLALIKAFNFKGNAIAKLQIEADKISNRILDPDDAYDFDELIKELKVYGVIFEE